jgi:hypothetical protein
MILSRRRAVIGALTTVGTAIGGKESGAVIILDGTWKAEGGARGREARGFRAHEALANQPQFAGVIPLSVDGGESWGIGSGTWLGNFGGNAWVLSASHLFTRSDSIFDYSFRAPDGTVCRGDRQVRHPLFDGNNETSTGYDVILLRIAGTMQGGGPAPLLYGGNREEGAQAVMVGYGARGLGSIGQHQEYDPPSATRTAATNVINDVMDMVQPPPSKDDRGNWLSVTLRRENEGAGRLDGLIGSGDSGGSLWIQTSAGWAIAGVNANGGEIYGEQSNFVRISGLRPWLSATLPNLRFAA